MTALVVRAVGSVLTVVIAVLVTGSQGESGRAEILAATIAGLALVALEGIVLWAPRKISWAHRLLDERANWVGVWVQKVDQVWPTTERKRSSNRFSVFRVDYSTSEESYELEGRAYGSGGNKAADWHSSQEAGQFPTFTKDGRTLSYVWTGVILGEEKDEREERDPSRSGLATMRLRKTGNVGKGRVQHVAYGIQFIFTVERVTKDYLKSHNLSEFSVAELREDDEARDRFAIALARTLFQGEPPVSSQPR